MALGHDGRSLDPRSGQRGALRRAHREIEEEVVVARHETRRPLGAERGKPRREVSQQQVPCRLAAHVQLVALVQALRRELEDLDRPLAVDEAAHERAETSAELEYRPAL